MNLKDYQLAAVRTESKIDRINGVSAVGLHAVLGLISASAEVADQIKKNVFYGRPYDREALNLHLQNASQMIHALSTFITPGNANQFVDPDLSLTFTEKRSPEGEPEKIVLDRSSLDSLDPRVFHAAIGTITEAGEIAAAIRTALETKELDLVNLAEEFGDQNWYINGIFPDASGIPAGQILDTNIGKLVKRFPDKFDGFLAQQENRDLDAERQILEDGAEGCYYPNDEVKARVDAYKHSVRIDNAAVDFFAEQMKRRLYEARTNKGRGGWETASINDLEDCLVRSLSSDNPERLINAANYAAMITWLKNNEVALTSAVERPEATYFRRAGFSGPHAVRAALIGNHRMIRLEPAVLVKYGEKDKAAVENDLLIESIEIPAEYSATGEAVIAQRGSWIGSEFHEVETTPSYFVMSQDEFSQAYR